MIHYEATDTRGLAVYNDGICILETDDRCYCTAYALSF